MRYYIIGTDGNVHGEANTYEECEYTLADITSYMEEEYGKEYVEDLELIIIESDC